MKFIYIFSSIITIFLLGFNYICDFFIFPPINIEPIKSHDNIKIFDNGNILVNTSNNKKVTLYYPGNAVGASTMTNYINSLKKNKNDILIVEYRNKGSKSGSFSTAKQNGLDAFEYCQSNYSTINIVAQSIGTGVYSEVIKHCDKCNEHSLTLVSCIPNLSDIISYLFNLNTSMTHLLFPHLASRNILSSHKNTPKLINIYHATNDSLSPMSLINKMITEIENNGIKVNLKKSIGDHNSIDPVVFF